MGAVIQLVAIGKQDVYLTGNPQISFFKMVYKRHTNFAMETVENVFNETPNFGTQFSSIISRKGDLIKDTYLEFSVTVLTNPNQSYINGLGNMIIKKVDFEIGGNIIDTQTGLYMQLYNLLSLPETKKNMYCNMVGYNEAYDPTIHAASSQNLGVLQVPLSFWYCRDAMSSLPLIALQYHEIKIIFEFEAINKCCNLVPGGSTVPTSNIISPKLWVKYIYLDNEERRFFAQQTHTYLIEQVQESLGPLNNTVVNYSIADFYHPVKELIWVLRTFDNLNNNNSLDFSNATADMLNNANITINGNDFFETQISEFFYRIMPFEHHTGNTNLFVYNYSFSLSPEKLQPTGTLNFGRTENAMLHMNTTTANVQINMFARNYNVLKIQNGMGGTLFST